MVVALLGWAITTYVMLESIPAGNRKYQQIIHDLISAKVETNVKPRVFFEDFPNLVLYARDVPRGGGGWKQLFLSDTRRQDEPLILMATRGRMIMDPQKQQVDLLLEDGSQHRPDKDDPGKYRVEHFKRHTIVLDPATVFPKSSALHGPAEMTIPELQAEIEVAKKDGRSPHNLIMAIQQKFSIPVACLVFGLLALSLGVSNRKDGKQASFVIGLAVVFVYWSLMYTGQSMAKAHWSNAHIAMWIPDIVLGRRRRDPAVLAPQVRRIQLPDHRADVERDPRSDSPSSGPERRSDAELAIDDASDLAAAGAVAGATSPSGAAAAQRAPPAPGQEGKVLVIRVPQGLLPEVPDPGRLRRTALSARLRADVPRPARHLLHRDVHRPVRQAVQRQRDRHAARPVPVVFVAAVRLLPAAALGPGLDARHRRPADQIQRADRDAGLRHQPVSRRGAGARARIRVERRAVRARGKHPGGVEPSGGTVEAHHARRLAPHVRRDEPPVDRQRRRQALSLLVFRSAPERSSTACQSTSSTTSAGASRSARRSIRRRIATTSGKPTRAGRARSKTRPTPRSTRRS